jgi:hypothetical protein
VVSRVIADRRKAHDFVLRDAPLHAGVDLAAVGFKPVQISGARQGDVMCRGIRRLTVIKTVNT